MLRSAFRELHGSRLHGFALLVTLGDRHLAETLAANALADGARRADSLRHPDRAAAWLRARVLRDLPRRWHPVGPSEEERREALAQLGVANAAFGALRALDVRQRAALVGGWIESLDPRDMEAVLRYRPAVLARVLADVRLRYLDGYRHAAREPAPLPADPRASGPLAMRIRAVADRAMARAGSVA